MRAAEKNKECAWLELNTKPTLQTDRHTDNHLQHEQTANGWLFRALMGRQGEVSLTEEIERETEALDGVRQRCWAHTGRERAIESPNGLFLITFLLNGISEEGIRLDAPSHRSPVEEVGKGS